MLEGRSLAFSPYNSAVGYPKGFMHGVVVGAVLGLLFAPQTGEELRRKLREVAGDIELADDEGIPVRPSRKRQRPE